MKSFRFAGIIISVLLIGYIGFCAVLPSRIEVALQQQVFARPEAVFYQLVCFKRWENWLAQKKFAPDTKFTYEGKDCWVGAEVKLGSLTFGNEGFRIDTVVTNSMVKVRLESSQFLNGELLYQLDSLGQSTVVKTQFVSNEIPFLKRPLVNVSLGSGEEMLRQSLNGLKREAELNLLERVRLYDFECPVQEIRIDEFTVAEIVAEIKMSQYPEFIANSKKTFEALETQGELFLSSKHYFFVLDSLSEGFKVSYGREIDITKFDAPELTVRTISETAALQSLKSGGSGIYLRNLALKRYNYEHKFGGRFKQWYEFDSSLDITEAMEMQPDRIIFPKSAVD